MQPRWAPAVRLHLLGAHLLPKLRCQFAEFLQPSSLKRLRIFISPTCVGLRYGRSRLELSGFSWELGIGAFAEQAPLVITPQLSRADLPTQHAYTFEPGQPTPGAPNLLRPHIASGIGTGILTCFPSTTHFCLALGADSPCADERCAGNLGLTATEPFTLFIATHVSSRTSDTSSVPDSTPSQAYGTLSYHAHKCASAASVYDLAPLHLPRRTTRSVSYYAFFKWWLLLSQHPDCFSLPTSFPT